MTISAREHKILIVDDEKTNLDVLIGLLRDHYKTIVAKNGVDALARANSENPPDLILLDIMMPSMDGFAVCEQLKANPATRSIPVIFVTALDQTGDETKGFALGAVDYINKPINPAILMARIQAQLTLAHYNKILEQTVQERTCELVKTQEALRASMGNLLTIQVAPGVFWLQIPEAGLYILCGCPAEVSKLLMLKGLNADAIKQGITFETGPNVILLSDVLIQNGGFANMAEFPVLQMLYRQGMIIPGHPNNSGIKPMLMGMADQVNAQIDYIHRGNYGLTKAEMIATGVDEETAEIMNRIKLHFSFGKVYKPTEFLDTLTITNAPQEIRNGAQIQRMGCNQFRFTYRGQTADVDLNLPKDVVYKSPYPLGFHSVQRHYFAVLHTGEGDGWDSQRPSMSSIIMFQGRIYLIDAIPGVLNVLTALGIDISEVEGIFHTHAHDDHFAGLPALIQTDRRLKYFATPLVRASVTKKFAALMAIEEEKFQQFFDIHDLVFDQWNQCGCLEVKPLYGPHPVETNLLLFRALDGMGYRTYAHWTDLTACALLDKMTESGPNQVPVDFINKIKKDYLYPTDLKKLDIGGGMIHGLAEDFINDPSKRIILAHLARNLTTQEMEIGSESTFGALDILIPGEQDYRRQRSFYYLRDLFPEISDDEIRMLINGPIINYNAGSFIRRENEPSNFVEMTISGDIIYLDSDYSIRYHLGFGAFMGLQPIFMNVVNNTGNYRAVSHSSILRIPVYLFKTFLENSKLFVKLEKVLEKVQFLRHTWLFGEQTSFVFLTKISQIMETITFSHGTLIHEILNDPTLWLVAKGQIALISDTGEPYEMIQAGGFFGEHSYLHTSHSPWRFQAVGTCELLRINWIGLLEAPIIHYKMLEIAQKRARYIT